MSSNLNSKQLRFFGAHPTVHAYVIFSCQLSINQCLISCSNMIWTFRIFCTLLFALCVQAQFNFPRKIHRQKGDPEKVHPKKVHENNKKGKYLLGSVFCWIMSILFPKKLFLIGNLIEIQDNVFVSIWLGHNFQSTYFMWVGLNPSVSYLSSRSKEVAISWRQWGRDFH